MPKPSAESFHPVPGVRRAREAHPLAKPGSSSHTNPHGKSMEQDHGQVTRTEVEKHDDGTAHVTAHHADGHVASHQHPHVQAAHDHAQDLMSGGDSMRSDGAVDTEDTCPNCGGSMIGGKCETCGYEKKDEAAEGESEESQEVA